MIKKLGGNIAIYGGTNAIKSLVPFLMLPILTSYLSIADYGILSLIEVSVLLISPFITLNIASAINVEYFKIEKKNLKHYISNALILSFLSMVFALLIFSFFKSYIHELINVSHRLIAILPVFAFLRVISSIVLGLYQVSERPKKFAIFTIIQTLIDFTLSYILVVWLQLGYIGRLDGIYLSLACMSLAGIIVLYKNDYLSINLVFKYTKKILSYGTPLIPHVLGGVMLAMSDRYFISYFYDNTIVGYYTVAYQIAGLMLLAGVSVNQAWMPMLYRLLNNYENNKKKISIYTCYLFMLFIFIGIIIYLTSDYIFDLLVNKKFFQAKAFFPYLLVGFMFQSLYYLYTNYLFYYKKTALLAKITFVGAALNIVLNYILILIYGPIGVAYATAITYIIYYFIVFYIVNTTNHRKEGV